MRQGIACLLCAIAFFTILSGPVFARDLSFEERLRAQEAIERVYWEHRIWPRESRTAKPALREVLSPAQIEARVVDDLRKANALATLFGRPMTAEDLRAEMKRMAASSQSPDVLRDLFAALDDDPFLIAETLARQTLADRWIREAYERRPLAAGSTFETWWSDTAPSIRAEILPTAGSYEAVQIVAIPECTPDSWRPIPAAPVQYLGTAAVWTGSEMILWGKYTPGEPARGARYNPATDSWITLSDLGAPSGRWGHRAVWTGREMIVWGGESEGGVELDSGGRYDPTTNLWRPTSQIGVPVGRVDHTAVWTGSEMIVWGGKRIDSIATLFNDGGRYNPVTDSWTPVSLTGAPTERAGHVVVWTGSEMIVWGGYSAHTLPRDGGRYYPASDTWTPTSTDGMPFPRHGTTAVWTGTEMIIWGGDLVSTGGRYDPVLDVWTPTSMYGVPGVLDGHVAIWTGHEMIVWGGNWYQSGGGEIRQIVGGRYNPAHDTWVPMSLQGAPAVPHGLAVVWTGREMLVWKEYAGTSNGYSARYCASTCDDDATRYADADGDGYGNPAAPLDFCAPADGFVGNALDCNDGNAGIRPGLVEVCNGIDDDCTGWADDGPLDRDGDHLSDACDKCPDMPGVPQTDTDLDGMGDYCDPCPLHPLNDRDGDGICEGADNCPDTANADQIDTNRDGAGDACQPVVQISGIRAAGNSGNLIATVSARDPEGETIHGDVAIMRTEPNDVVLQDLGYTYDCGMGFFPEGVASDGVGFASGSVGEPMLFDLDASAGCDDGVPDYALGLGACDAPGTILSGLLPLTGVPLPATGCLRKVGTQYGGRPMLIYEITPDAARLSFPDLVAVHRVDYDVVLPRRILLPALTIGATYTLRITATDGSTPTVAATSEFVYKGEKQIQLIHGPRGTLATPTRPTGVGVIGVGVVSP